MKKTIIQKQKQNIHSNHHHFILSHIFIFSIHVQVHSESTVENNYNDRDFHDDDMESDLSEDEDYYASTVENNFNDIDSHDDDDLDSDISEDEENYDDQFIHEVNNEHDAMIFDSGFDSGSEGEDVELINADNNDHSAQIIDIDSDSGSEGEMFINADNRDHSTQIFDYRSDSDSDVSAVRTNSSRTSNRPYRYSPYPNRPTTSAGAHGAGPSSRAHHHRSIRQLCGYCSCEIKDGDDIRELKCNDRHSIHIYCYIDYMQCKERNDDLPANDKNKTKMDKRCPYCHERIVFK